MEIRNALALQYIFMGALSLMMLYMLILFFQNPREKTYLFYALYMLCNLMYMGAKFRFPGFISDLFASNRLFYAHLNETIQMLLFLFYNGSV